MTLGNILINKLRKFKENIIKAIPTPNNETPLSDVNNGSKGKSPNYARSDHQHPLSTAYATANHNHGQIDKDGKLSTTTSTVGNVVVTDGSNIVKVINKLPISNLTNVSTVNVTVTYTDNTPTETITLLKYTGS